MALIYQHTAFIYTSHIWFNWWHAQTASLGVNKTDNSLIIWRIHLLRFITKLHEDKILGYPQKNIHLPTSIYANKKYLRILQQQCCVMYEPKHVARNATNTSNKLIVVYDCNFIILYHINRYAVIDTLLKHDAIQTSSNAIHRCIYCIHSLSLWWYLLLCLCTEVNLISNILTAVKIKTASF